MIYQINDTVLVKEPSLITVFRYANEINESDAYGKPIVHYLAE